MKLCRKGLHDKDDPANIYARKDGRTQCKPCMLEAHRAYMKKRRIEEPEFRALESARSSEWQRNNKAHREKYEAEWRAANREKRNGYSKADYQRHREKRLAYQARWREANRERLNELVRNWAKANPDRRTAHQARRRARKFAAESDNHTRADVLEWWGHDCWLCGIPLPKGWHEDHVIPLSKGGSDLLENCRPSCPPCNLSKSNKLVSIEGGIQIG